MTHKLVMDLRFAREKFLTNFENLSAEDAEKRVGKANSIGWIVGHLAQFEQQTWCEGALGKVVHEDVKGCGFGMPASTPAFDVMLTAWWEITAVSNTYLNTLTEDDMGKVLTRPDGKPYGENIGTMIYRHIWHYWYHMGEIQGIRQALGHENLPQFIGRLSPEAKYAPNQAKQLVDEMYGGLNQNVLGLMQKYWKQDMVWEGPAGIGTMNGIDEFEHSYRDPFIQAFPDKHATDIVRIAEGNWVAGTGYQNTTFAEDWLGLKASGEKIRMRYMDFWRVEEDEESGERKLAENLVLIDILGVLEQTGYDISKVLKFIGSKPPEFFDELE